MMARVGRLLLLVAMFGAVYGVDINGCMEITDSGDYDVVAALTGANVSTTLYDYPDFQSCIHILASDVVLDCHGRSITATDSGSVAIAVGDEASSYFDSVTVRDCVISGYGTGIHFNFVRDGALTNNVVHGCDGSGILLVESISNELTGNRAYGNGADGIALLTSAMNTLEDNTAYSNENAGILVWSEPMAASDNILTDNNVYDNSYGIYVVRDRYNEFYSNHVHGNGIGIQLENADENELNGDHFYGNDVDLLLDSISTNTDVTLTGEIFDSSEGHMASYTNLSLFDRMSGGSAYSITWVSPPAMPDGYALFRGKAIDISPLSGSVSIDEISWLWTAAELSGYSYENLSLWHYDAGDWVLVSDEPDFHYLSVTDLGVFSPFAILYQSRNQTGDDGGDSEPNLTLSFSSTCDGNIVTVISNEYPVSGARVSVDGQTAGTTGNNGHIIFQGCGKNVSITAVSQGYGPANITVPLVDCLQCYECVDDGDCPTNEYCSNHECIALNCSCGYVAERQCVPYDCCSDQQCGANQSCTNHTCVQDEPPDSGCRTDADCAPVEYCNLPTGASSGTCDDVIGDCGYADNHAWIQYECGSEAGCGQCPAGQLCSGHSCVPYVLTCPERVVIGDSQTCNTTQGDVPCANCDYIITDPLGKTHDGKTGSSGLVVVPFDTAGTYRVALMKNGTVVRALNIEALPKSSIQEPEKPVAISLTDPPVCLLLLLLAILALFIYWRYIRRKGRKEEAVSEIAPEDGTPKGGALEPEGDAPSNLRSPPEI